MMRDLINLVEFAQAPAVTGFGADLKYLLKVQHELPADSALRGFIDQIFDTTGDILKLAADLPGLQEAVVQYSGAKSNKSFIEKYADTEIDALYSVIMSKAPTVGIDPAKLSMLLSDARSLTETIKRRKNPEVQKAATAAIKGIQLNAQGQFAKLTKEIEDNAMKFVDRFGVKPIWARNLVGMFTAEISLKERTKFLDKCLLGQAMDIKSMIRNGHGTLDTVVDANDKTINKIFQSIKDTLLDISLSTGQRGATGPFEAMLAIMGGARKPDANEGGDLKIKIDEKDIKFEVKAGSLTIDTGGKNPSASESSAWLDSTGELSGDNLRGKGDEYLNKYFPNLPPVEKNLWANSDFRSSKLVSLRDFLNKIENRKKGSAIGLLTYMMTQSFPSATTLPEFNFRQSVRNILKNIIDLNAKGIAKEQGTMALLEYAIGKGNDGFILFNSSVQEYKIIMGVKGIIDLYHNTVVEPPGKSLKNDYKPEWDESIVRFLEPMTMKRGAAKCSPSIYYGPLGKSKRAKEYAAKFATDPERLALRAKAQQSGDAEFIDANSGFITPSEDEKSARPTRQPRVPIKSPGAVRQRR